MNGINTMRRYIFLIIFATALLPMRCASPAEEAEPPTATNEFVPEWAKTVVWYQIFPERFRDGDPNNNPTVQDLAGADPAEPPRHWQVHPWGSDWYELQEYEKLNGEPELWKHLLRRRYGGDLQGIIDKLDYLQDLGIGAIYLNPVFVSPSLHKYDAASYHHIDPNFGPDPEGDRKLIAQENPLDPNTWVWTSADLLALKLIRAAHAHGMRVIFDGVFNHMGINSFAFQDVLKNQQDSPYRDWFIIKSWNDPQTGEGFDYQGWFGVKSLPEFREDSTGLAPGPKAYVFHAAERWMNPQGRGIENGIDGWRLDVAYMVGHPFWKQWRAHVKAINPDAYLTAELVLPVDEVRPYLQGDEFDGEMNYNFAFAAAEFFFNPDSMRITASEYDRALATMRNAYPVGVAYVSQNLFGSHDANRIGSHIVNRGIGNFRNWGTYFQRSQAANNPDYDVRKPNEEEIRLQKLFVIMQMTYVGAPMIYYGDEVGMWGANDPDARKPMIWDDITYADEVFNPDGTKRAPDKVAVNQDLLAHYQKLIAIRNRYKALQTGRYETLLADDTRDIFAFERTEGEQRIVVALNNASSPATVALPRMPAACYVDLMTEQRHDTANDTLVLPIEQKWGAVLTACE